jgi:GAF domain-containing protein
MIVFISLIGSQSVRGGHCHAPPKSNLPARYVSQSNYYCLYLPYQLCPFYSLSAIDYFLPTMALTPSFLLPANETKRLQTLRAYDILHSLQEPLFTEVVELTATLFNVPISLIALVGADEVEYKAVHGLPGLRSQPRVEAICALAVKEEQVVVFTDLAHSHALTPQADLAAQAKGLRFYAGAPICVPDGDCLGTLCLIDRQPRSFSAAEQLGLEQHAQLVALLIMVRQHCLVNQKLGQAYWSAVRTELAWEMQALIALVRYLATYSGTHIPVPTDVLRLVGQRLDDFRSKLADYYAGPF